MVDEFGIYIKNSWRLLPALLEIYPTNRIILGVILFDQIKTGKRIDYFSQYIIVYSIIHSG